jgi:hypothetical protein
MKHLVSLNTQQKLAPACISPTKSFTFKAV